MRRSNIIELCKKNLCLMEQISVTKDTEEAVKSNRKVEREGCPVYN